MANWLGTGAGDPGDVATGGSLGVGTTGPTEKLEVNGNAKTTGGAWNSGHLVMGAYHLWVDTSGRLRIKSSAPISALDGTVVGTQS